MNSSATAVFFENSETLLTPEEVAFRLKVKRKTLYNWAYRGSIPFMKIGKRLLRFRARDIEQWLKTKE